MFTDVLHFHLWCAHSSVHGLKSKLLHGLVAPATQLTGTEVPA